MTGQEIGGYVFSKPRLVPGTLPYGIELFTWLPNDPNKILIVRDGVSLEVIDINTGEAQIYHQGDTLITNAVWLPERQAAAYLVSDAVDYAKQYLHISEGQKQSVMSPSSPAFTTTLSPLAVTPDGSGVILFNTNWQLTQVGTLNTQAVKLTANMQLYAPTGDNQGDMYRVVQSADRNKAIYFNNNWVLLVEFTTGRVTPIDLQSLRTKDMPPIDHIQVAVWSPKGEKVAFLIASGGVYEGNNLFILDLQSNGLSFVEDSFHYIDNIAWSPDNIKIIMLATTGNIDGYNTGSLFLVNTISREIKPVAALPEGAIIGSPGDLIWSLDGKLIAVTFGNEPRRPGTYIIDVK